MDIQSYWHTYSEKYFCSFVSCPIHINVFSILLLPMQTYNQIKTSNRTSLHVDTLYKELVTDDYKYRVSAFIQRDAWFVVPLFSVQPLIIFSTIDFISKTTTKYLHNDTKFTRIPFAILFPSLILEYPTIFIIGPIYTFWSQFTLRVA